MAEFIDEELYKKILEVLPIACVDCVVTHEGRFLLSRRTNKPAQGQWWLLGGRILKGETLEEAAQRKMRQEIGTEVESLKFLTGKETIFPDSAQGPSSHTVNFVFTSTVDPAAIRKDAQSAELQWFAKIDPSWDPYVKAMLAKAGFSLDM